MQLSGRGKSIVRFLIKTIARRRAVLVVVDEPEFITAARKTSLLPLLTGISHAQSTDYSFTTPESEM
jgi:hypothetical protein